jgi:hypothetical protein
LDAPRVLKKTFLQKKQCFGQGFRWYERAGERPERTKAVALKEWWTGLQLAVRDSKFTDERACQMSSIRNLSWPSQWRFQISAQIHPKFELTSQSVVIEKPIRNFEVRIHIHGTVYGLATVCGSISKKF